MTKKNDKETVLFIFLIILATVLVFFLCCAITKDRANDDLLSKVCVNEYGKNYELSKRTPRTMFLEVPTKIECSRKEVIQIEHGEDFITK